MPAQASSTSAVILWMTRHVGTDRINSASRAYAGFSSIRMDWLLARWPALVEMPNVESCNGWTFPTFILNDDIFASIHGHCCPRCGFCWLHPKWCLHFCEITWRVVKNFVYFNGFDGESSVSLLPKSRCWDSTSSVTNSCGKMLNSPWAIGCMSKVAGSWCLIRSVNPIRSRKTWMRSLKGQVHFSWSELQFLALWPWFPIKQRVNQCSWDRLTTTSILLIYLYWTNGERVLHLEDYNSDPLQAWKRGTHFPALVGNAGWGSEDGPGWSITDDW